MLREGLGFLIWDFVWPCLRFLSEYTQRDPLCPPGKETHEDTIAGKKRMTATTLHKNT